MCLQRLKLLRIKIKDLIIIFDDWSKIIKKFDSYIVVKVNQKIIDIKLI